MGRLQLALHLGAVLANGLCTWALIYAFIGGALRYFDRQSPWIQYVSQSSYWVYLVHMPLVCLATFLIKTRDPFGASVALWWTAESFMDIAPYIDDARAMDLMLLGGVTGKETDGHDWNNILTMLGWLEYDHRLAHLAYNFGVLLMLASFAWGGLLLLKHYRRLSP